MVIHTFNSSTWGVARSPCEFKAHLIPVYSELHSETLSQFFFLFLEINIFYLFFIFFLRSQNYFSKLMIQNIELYKQLVKVQRISNCGMLSPRVCITESPLRLWNHGERADRTDVRSRGGGCPTHSRVAAHRSSQWLCQHGKTCASSSQTKSHHDQGHWA